MDFFAFQPKIADHKKSLRENLGCEQLLHIFVHYVYSPFLGRKPVKIFVIVLFSIFLGVGIYGTCTMTLGLELTDLVPKGTAPYDFLRAREQYFSFYPMNLIIKGTGMLQFSIYSFFF